VVAALVVDGRSSGAPAGGSGLQSTASVTTGGVPAATATSGAKGGTTAPANGQGPSPSATTTTHSITLTPTSIGSVVYRGRGNADLTIRKPGGQGPALATIATGAGGGRLTITAFAGARPSGTLVDAPAPYTGMRVLDSSGQESNRLVVRAPGSWTVTLRPPAAAPLLAQVVGGQGDLVYRYPGPATHLAVSNSGTGPVVVESIGAGPTQVLVTLGGGRKATVALPSGPLLVAVSGAGPWSLRLVP
jgi:hypothetical protein